MKHQIQELEEVTAAYRNAVGQQQKAAAVVETTRGENARKATDSS